MSIPAEHSARISQHVYGNPDDPVPFKVGARLELDGKRYDIVKIVEDKLLGTGYQGAIYQDQATGELIVAHRGTETSLITPLLKDGAVDAQMVLARANAQTPFAEALTRDAMEMARNPRFWPDGVTSEPAVSHTGHSLGGYHAQLQAWMHGHGGASFNAFGAAGIGSTPAGIVEGAPPFVSYMRATDVVPASSRQYGDVVAFATEADVAMVTRPGARPGVEGPIGFVRNVANDALARHSIDSFVNGGLVTEANRTRALDHQPAFAEQQRAVHGGREWATYAGDIAQPGIVAAAIDLSRPGNPVLSSPVIGLAQAATAGLVASTDVARRTPQPDAVEPLQRTEGDVIRHSLEIRAGLNEVGAQISERRAGFNAGLNDFVETTGLGVQQTITAVKGHVSNAVDDVGDLGAEAHRRWGEINQGVANAQAGVLDAIGLAALAERQRVKGLDARVDAENAALDTERGSGKFAGVVDKIGRQAIDATQEVTDAMSTPIEASTARHQANAAGARVEAQGMRHGAAVIPEVLYGSTAPNLDLRATAREKIEALYAEHGRPPLTPEQLDRMSAAMVADARGQGMKRIGEVMFSQGDNAPDFNGKLICFDGVAGGDHTRFACTPIAKALETPVEQSVERTRAANERQEQFQLEIQQMQARDQALQESHGMSMRIGARTMDGPGDGAGASAGGGDGGGGG